jgi:hypothetical protein
MYLLDYVRANARVTSAVEPYNEVDMLAFASLPYLELEGAVSTGVSEEDRSIGEAAALYRVKMHGDPNPPGLFIPRDFIDIFLEMENAPRYRDLKIYGFRYLWSLEREEQFSAVGLETPEGEQILTIAGTDDTLLGWKEDLNLAVNGHIAGQETSVEYVNDILKNRTGPFIMCGFSKGGHLAVYAPAMCNAPERLKRVYDFDGPGFRDDFLACERFRAIADRCLLIAPRYSAVSRMLNNIPNYVVTRGTRRGLYQHYSNRWIVEGNRFLREPDFADGAKQFHEEFMKLLNETPEEDRRLSMDTLFQVASESGIQSLTEIWRKRSKTVPDIISAIFKLPKEQRDVVFPFWIRMMRMTTAFYGGKR